jgi:protein O-mannosyl-transferase
VVLVSSRALNSVGTLAPAGAEVSTKLLRVMENYVFYLEKSFWPSRLSVLYPTESIQASAAVLSGWLLAAITGFAWWQRQKQPWLLVGWLWFLGTLVPVIGFVTFGHFYVGDRYTYIPSIGLIFAVVMGLGHWLRRFPLAHGTLAVTLIVLCALATRADLLRWQNTFTLYDAALEVGPHHVTYNNRGTAYRATGDRRHALADFNAAIRSKPDYAAAHVNRAAVWIDLGKYAEAVADCTRAVELDPQNANAYNNRGNAFSSRGDLDRAIADYSAAIKLNPGRALYYNNRAAARFRLQQPVLAKADLDRCVQLGGQPHPGLIHDLNEALRPPSY